MIAFVYFGRRFTTKQHGTELKTRVCERCKKPFDLLHHAVGVGMGNSAYFLDDDGAGIRSKTAAEKDLRRRLKEVPIEPCPHCGWYQGDMVFEHRIRHPIGLMFAGCTLIGGVCIVGASLREAKSRETLVVGVTFGTIVALLCAWLIYRLMRSPNRSQ